MAQLTVQQIAMAGVVPTYGAAASGGDTFLNNGRTFLHFKNGSGSPITVTIDSLVNCNQGFDHNLAVSVLATSESMIGPLDQSRFNAPSTSLVSITYSGVTSLTVAALSL